jgi:hypothetical protein
MTDYSPDVPAEIVEIAAEWHGGQASEMYAIASTGGLTLNSDRTRSWTDADRLEFQSDRWSRLAGELADPIAAGAVGADAADYCLDIADKLADAADALTVPWRHDPARDGAGCSWCGAWAKVSAENLCVDCHED